MQTCVLSVYYVKVKISYQFNNESIEGFILYDFSGLVSFIALYIPGTAQTLEYFNELLSSIKYNETTFNLDKLIILPSIRAFHGVLHVENTPEFELKMKFFGDPEWTRRHDINASRRIFIYSETNFKEAEILQLKKKAKEFNHELQYRSDEYVNERTKFDKPFAFISHDSRDKEEIAKKIALNLSKRLCSVWYDDFSLRVGQNLRESIEKGLKECKKCILIISPNFINNNGWTKSEFDAIFTRSIIQKTNFFLPVWLNISREEIFNYSPTLPNIVGLDWNKLGEEKVCTELYKAIMI